MTRQDTFDKNLAHGLTLLLTFIFSNGSVHKIRHFSCERDFYVFRNHMYKTYFESFNLSQRYRCHTNHTFSSDLCFMRFLGEIVWVKICLKHKISKHIQISLTSEVSYLMGNPVVAFCTRCFIDEKTATENSLVCCE